MDLPLAPPDRSGYRSPNSGARRGRWRLWLHAAAGAVPRRGPDPQRRVRRTPVLPFRRHHPRPEDDRLPAAPGRARARASDIAAGAPHRGRLFHLHHKPMYAAIEQADNRHRKPMTLGRMVERLMVLDAVLADRTCTWLGTEFDKRSYFTRRLRERVKLDEFPRLTFGTGTPARHRYLPDKLAIGISDGDENHVFVYLVTSGVPMDFRLFLLRHAEVLRGLYRWTVRVLVPSPFVPAIRLFGQAARETLATPLAPSNAEALCSVFRGRRRRRDTASALPIRSCAPCRSPTVRRGSARCSGRGNNFGDPVVWAAQSGGLRDALQRGEGRVEFVKLTRQLPCHLSSLVGVACLWASHPALRDAGVRGHPRIPASVFPPAAIPAPA